MRIGIFGGTFDPIHLGHLILAEHCREQARLDQVRFIPAARPPHKQDRPLTPFPTRSEMLALAIAGQPAFLLDEIEKDRPGPSYTVDTLEELRRRLPDDRLVLLIGADCIPDLLHWKAPDRLGELAEIFVWPRLGWEQGIDEMRSGRPFLQGVKLDTAAEVPFVNIASHDLRARVAASRTIRYLVPRAVECYIESHRLYRNAGAG